MRLAYFVHDLSDPAVSRRLKMLRAGGAQARVLGFRRTSQPVLQIDGVEAVDLGRTYDARMGHRALQTLKRCALARRLVPHVADCDVVMARNLEMLAIANAARRSAQRSTKRSMPLVYESLDIHRLLLSSAFPGKALRAVERALLKACSLVVVSSPAFLRAHFDRYRVKAPILLLENKLLQLGSAPMRVENERQPGPPWRIGWFGMLRCSKTLSILKQLVEQAQGGVEVIIRGRPAYSEFEDFDAIVNATPGMVFKGPYNASELAEAYNEVHFCWAIDYFEEGLNSNWLLPNRLYEGSFYGAVPIVLDGCETARWLSAHQAGVCLKAPLEEIRGFFEGLTPERYRTMVKAIEAIPEGDLVATSQDCCELVQTLATGAI